MNHEDAVTLSDIEQARRRIGEQVTTTPLLYAPRISEKAGASVYLKCENLQRTGSFKLRGATNKIKSLLESGSAPLGVITGSSGNHGQAVAFAAKSLGLGCTVIVPETVAPVKEQAILRHGAEVIRHGKTSNERIDLAQNLARERGFIFIPPYDNPHVVAGQGTIGLEILEQLPEVQAVFVPVGGGGLISGIATAIKNRSPHTRIYGVEPELANDTYLSRRAGHIVDIGVSTTVADGLRSSHPGTFTFPIVQKYVDELMLVDDAEIHRTLLELLGEEKLLVELSGCVSVAAATQAGTSAGGGPIVCVLSGGNVDLDLVRRWIEEDQKPGPRKERDRT
ncbi:threonine/serine dehydratase [Kyrpidia spormannii]|uniref:Serine/threonine dehydratase n=1 Tax=Kyrpidia spormannii TaxID=2055160 RepID=A0ACA8Z7V5_9BACL|nr:threonine/serine dehydratase [Kyrpidia spormannii]CAB3391332.1 Serine/threonine dehydratase [Kyrpidia spormannii]